MKRSMMMLILAGTLVTLLVAGGTMAWFTAAQEVENNFTAGTVAVTVNEHDFQDITNWNPGDTTNKDVSVKSTGSKKTYVRVSLTPLWTPATGTAALSLANVTLNTANPGDWVFYNGWYYYKHILETNEETSLLLDSITFSGPLTNNTYQGAKLNVKVNAEAVQASNGAALDTWGLTQVQFDALGLELIP